MSTNSTTFTAAFRNQPVLITNFSTEYLTSKVAKVTISLYVNDKDPIKSSYQIEIGQQYPIGLEWLRGTLTMSPKAVLSFSGEILAEGGQFSIKDSIIAVNS